MHRLAFSIPHRGPHTPSLSTRLSAQAAAAARLQAALPGRTYATSSSPKEDAEGAPGSGSHGDVSAKGRTGGGEPLDSSVNPPPQPKVRNASIPLGKGKDALSQEQQEEVDRHNADFEKKHDRASSAAEDKVDKDFWKGSGGRDGR